MVLAIKLSVKYGKRPSSVLKINVAKFHLTNRTVTDLSNIADFTIQNFGIEGTLLLDWAQQLL